MISCAVLQVFSHITTPSNKKLTAITERPVMTPALLKTKAPLGGFSAGKKVIKDYVKKL